MRIWQQRAEREGRRQRGRKRGVPQLHRQTLQLSITLTVKSGDALLPAAACSTHTPRWPVKERHPVHSLAELTDNYFSALVRCRPRCELYSVMHMDVDVNVNVHVDIFRGHSSVHSLIHFATYSIFYAALRRFCGRRAEQQQAAEGCSRVRVQCSFLVSVAQQFVCINSGLAGAAQK